MDGEFMDFVVMGAGAGLKGAIAGLLKKYLPGEISDDLIGLIAGFLLYKFGARVHPMVTKFGAGMVIGSIGGLVEGAVAGKLTAGVETEAGTEEATIGGITTDNFMGLAWAEASKPATI